MSVLPGPPVGALLRDPPAPGEACRLRQRRGLHLRDGPLPYYPALREARAGNVEKLPIPGEQAAPGSPGWVATHRVGPGREKETARQVEAQGESFSTVPQELAPRTRATRSFISHSTHITSTTRPHARFLGPWEGGGVRVTLLEHRGPEHHRHHSCGSG